MILRLGSRSHFRASLVQDNVMADGIAKKRAGKDIGAEMCLQRKAREGDSRGKAVSQPRKPAMIRVAV